MTTRHCLQTFIGIALLACLSTACAGSSKSGTAMERILAYHQKGKHDLDAKGLPLDKEMKPPEKPEEAGYEVHNVPYPPNYADYFKYRVLLHTATGRYWINISGGIAGANRCFGPGKVADLKE